MRKLNKFFRLILQGRGFYDKIKVILYFFGIKNNLYLNNEDGLFFVRKNSSDLWMLSTLGEERLRRYFNLEEGVFLDVGANVGKYSITLGRKLRKGKVYSVEPEPSTIKALEKNIFLNELKNIKIIPFACLDREGKLKIYIDAENSGGHSLVNKSKNSVEVNVTTIDTIVKTEKIKKVNLIKIDVEGVEDLVLKGAMKVLKRDHPKLIFEAWNNNQFKKCKKILNKEGYNYEKIGSQDYFAY